MNRICKLFRHPLPHHKAVWCGAAVGGWPPPSAKPADWDCSSRFDAPETLVEHIRKMKAATDRPWGVNVPLMYPEIDRLMDILIREEVKIVFTSAGSPKKFTLMLHEAGVTVAHVVSSSKFARKCEEAGVDAIVAEGFEAGGHNGREETTTLTLIPQVRRATCLPVVQPEESAAEKRCWQPWH